MPVKIRLMRVGSKKRPFYRVVAVDERKKRTGGYLELLGTYNPLTEPKEIILNTDKINEWIKKGAVLSDGYLRITKQAPPRPPRKPKKEKETKKEDATPVEEKNKEESVAEEKEITQDSQVKQAEEETPIAEETTIEKPEPETDN